MTTGLEACEHYLKTQLHLSQGRHVATAKVLPFVTISRQAGAGGITVGRMLEAYLREHDKDAPCPWTLFDKQLVTEMIEQHELPEGFSETILHLAAMGHVILVGRGSNIITRKLAGGFHVRLIGSHEKRVRHIQAYYGFGAHASEEFLRKEDETRADYLKRHFQADIDDPLLYDLVINTDCISYGEAARIIGHAALAGGA